MNERPVTTACSMARSARVASPPQNVPDGERRLSDQVNFATATDALGRDPAALKTHFHSRRRGHGGRKMEIARRGSAQGGGSGWTRWSNRIGTHRRQNNNIFWKTDAAFAKGQRDNPALFEAMQKPKQSDTPHNKGKKSEPNQTPVQSQLKKQ